MSCKCKRQAQLHNVVNCSDVTQAWQLKLIAAETMSFQADWWFPNCGTVEIVRGPHFHFMQEEIKKTCSDAGYMGHELYTAKRPASTCRLYNAPYVGLQKSRYLNFCHNNVKSNDYIF